MSDVSSHDENGLPSPTLKEKFIAWWEGYDLSALVRRRPRGEAGDADGRHGHGPVGADGAAAATKGSKHLNRQGKPLWTATRIEVVEKIWGDGFATPGGSDHIPTLVKPLGLNPAMSILDIGAGLGGSIRSMVQQYGAWTTGLEYNPLLAEAGMERSHKAGLARQAPIQLFDPESFAWSKRVDAVFSKEAFYTIRNKDGLIDTIEKALKPRGHLLFTDYVVSGSASRGRDFDSWSKHEPVEPHPWTVEQYVEALQRRGMDIRITEDVSALHEELILNAIQVFVKHLETVAPDRATKITVVEEVELWARRVAALNAGLRVYRFYALKPAEVR